ncbi:MAG: hypothetical protein KME23_03975 [Goleter apudmare HA4340-LM2]|jgi:hypothetical protein|nr:hypothetical protein [Goleter apudmare HA4340-LM2]
MGGVGNDQFVYTKISDRGDPITVFAVGKNVIVLTRLLDSLVRGGDAISDGYVRVVQGNSASNFQVEIDTDGVTGKKTFLPLNTVNVVGGGSLNDASNFVI